MVFFSYTFLFFALGTAAVYYLLPKKLQNPILLLSSFVFYGCSMPQFLPLLLATGTVCYLAARVVENKTLKHRKALFLLFLLLLAAPLFVYKYLGFFGGMVLAAFGQSQLTLSLALPLGISFYTFQCMGYLIDCYSGAVKAERSFVNCMLFVCFFPQLTSGPIGRAKSLLPQYAAPRSFSLENLRIAGARFLCGLFKKAVIADNLSRFVDLYYRSPGSYPTADVTLFVLVCYVFQLFFDFSGYSDMAIAAGRLFGIVLPENFASPYFAPSCREFWRRWHMSLTGWFQDYLFTPLVWSRWADKLLHPKDWPSRRPNMLLNLTLVFVVSGLWHGAAATFLLWGLIQGLLRMPEEWMLPKKRSKPKNAADHAVRTAAVLLSWGLSLVFFRSDSMGTAMEVFRYLTRFLAPQEAVNHLYRFVTAALGGSMGGYEKLTLLLLAVSLLFALYLELRAYKAGGNELAASLPVSSLPEWTRAAAFCFFYLSVACIGQLGSSSFIYHNF